jgi:SAM-dependent methyltransferase
MRLLLERKIPFPLSVIYVFIIKVIAKVIGAYHPVILNDSVVSTGERSCSDRWEKIKIIMEDNKVKSVLDLGCAEGFFVHSAAKELSCFSLGIDADIRRLNLASNSALINEIENCGFIYMEIVKENIEKLPESDVIIFLSVLHHVMYEKGEDEALSLLKSIKKITNKVMFFDMGQSNEGTQEWATLLPDMGDDPLEWIKAFLLKAGFSKIVDLGLTDSYRTSTKRHYFAAYV